MPGYQDHLLIGSLLSALAIYLLQPYLRFDLGTTIATVAFILLASVFPDVDHRNAKIHTMLRSFLVLVGGGAAAVTVSPDLPRMIAIGLLAGTAIYLLFDALKPRHRTVTHTFTAAVVFSIGVGIFCLLFLQTFVPSVFALVAYTSHLAIDGTLD